MDKYVCWCNFPWQCQWQIPSNIWIYTVLRVSSFTEHIRSELYIYDQSTLISHCTFHCMTTTKFKTFSVSSSPSAGPFCEEPAAGGQKVLAVWLTLPQWSKKNGPAQWRELDSAPHDPLLWCPDLGQPHQKPAACLLFSLLKHNSAGSINSNYLFSKAL